MKNFITCIGYIFGAILVVALIVSVMMYQFSIYQKKHGEQMNLMDFVFDAERK